MCLDTCLYIGSQDLFYYYVYMYIYHCNINCTHIYLSKIKLFVFLFVFVLSKQTTILKYTYYNNQVAPHTTISSDYYYICVLSNSLREIKNTFYEIVHKKMECHNLQTFHWHYRHTYTQQTTQHTVVATFQFFDAG